MESFFQYLASNPTQATILFAVFIVIVLVLLGIVLDAYRKGQPLSLGLIKIEAKPSKIGLPEAKTLDQQGGCEEQVALADRENFPKPFMARLQKAKEVRLLGINVNGIVKNYEDFIVAKAKGGCRFKFLIINPNFFASKEMLYALWPGGSRSREDVGSTIRTIKRISERVGNDNIELHYMSFPPPYTVLMINPDESDGEIQIESYTFQSLTNKRPHFILNPKNHSYWYDFFYKDFEIIWKQSDIHNPTEGLMPVIEKAGVVVYRKLSDGSNLEFLLITPRPKPRPGSKPQSESKSQKWIFPLGEVDPGETLEQAAIRECVEESGYIVEIVAELGTISVEYGSSTDRFTFFLAEEKSEKNNYDEKGERERCWVRPSQVVSMVVDDFKPIAQSALMKLKV